MPKKIKPNPEQVFYFISLINSESCSVFVILRYLMKMMGYEAHFLPVIFYTVHTGNMLFPAGTNDATGFLASKTAGVPAWFPFDRHWYFDRPGLSA